jgi:hypothetical protein
LHKWEKRLSSATGENLEATLRELNALIGFTAIDREAESEMRESLSPILARLHSSERPTTKNLSLRVWNLLNAGVLSEK